MKTTFSFNKETLESTMERIFNAPRALLWKAHVDPTLMQQWWGPSQYEVIVEEYDVAPEGRWKITHKGNDENGQNQEYSFYGEFKDMNEPESITWTFNFEPFGPGHEIIETVRFEDLGDGTTKVSTISYYKSLEDLEGMIESGMEQGADETWNRLEALAQSMDSEEKMF